jgi:hypothetical protein
LHAVDHNKAADLARGFVSGAIRAFLHRANSSPSPTSRAPALMAASKQNRKHIMFSKVILTAATALTIAAAGFAAPSMAQARTRMDGASMTQYSRDLLPNYDREINGSDASTPGHN